MFKETQNNIINAAERALRKTGLTDKTLCILLRGIHIIVFPLFFYCILFGSNRQFHFAVVYAVTICTIFIGLNGCMLTKIETKFAQDDFNIIDPLLLIFNADRTKANRYNYTIGLNVFIGISLPLIYYLRFGTH